MTVNSDSSSYSYRRPVAFGRHFERTRIVRAALLPSGALGDRHFVELAARWQVSTTPIVVQGPPEFSTEKMLIEVLEDDDQLDAETGEFDSVSLDLLHIPVEQQSAVNQPQLLMTCEFVVFILDAAEESTRTIADVALLAQSNPHCFVLVVALHHDRLFMPSAEQLSRAFMQAPQRTRFLVFPGDSKLSTLELARTIESITVDIARMHSKWTRPAFDNVAADLGALPHRGARTLSAGLVPRSETQQASTGFDVHSDLAAALHSLKDSAKRNEVDTVLFASAPQHLVETDLVLAPKVEKKRNRFRSALSK